MYIFPVIIVRCLEWCTHNDPRTWMFVVSIGKNFPKQVKQVLPSAMSQQDNTGAIKVHFKSEIVQGHIPTPYNG